MLSANIKKMSETNAVNLQPQENSIRTANKNMVSRRKD